MPENTEAPPLDARPITATLDVRGLPCPVPVLKAQKALAALPPGAVLEIWASDPASGADMAALCMAMNHTLILSEAKAARGAGAEAEFRFLIERGASRPDALPTG